MYQEQYLVPLMVMQKTGYVPGKNEYLKPVEDNAQGDNLLVTEK